MCFHDCCKWKHRDCTSVIFLINVWWLLAFWLCTNDLIKQTGLTTRNRPKCHVHMPIGLLAGILLLLYFARYLLKKSNDKKPVIHQEMDFHWNLFFFCKFKIFGKFIKGIWVLLGWCKTWYLSISIHGRNLRFPKIAYFLFNCVFPSWLYIQMLPGLHTNKWLYRQCLLLIISWNLKGIFW